MATDRTVKACLINGNTKLPVRRSNSKPSVLNNNNNNNNNRNNDEGEKWRMKYEEAEERRKKLLSEKEKAQRSVHDFERRFSSLQIKNEEMETELFERNESLAKLTIASKSLFKEYDALKNQYEVESNAMSKALVDASQWYRENKILRRRTMLLDSNGIDEGVDTNDANSDSDLDNLKETVKNLSQEVAHLQAELNSAKLIEFETTESNVQLAQDLEEEKRRNEKLQHEIAELNQSHEQMLRVSNMMKKELQDLKEMVTNQKSNEVLLRKEANDYRKECNVLTHRSTLLMQEFSMEDASGLVKIDLIEEIETLKRQLEEERNKHASEVHALREHLDEQEANSYQEVLEERLKLVEAELQHAVERADKAEAALQAAPSVPPPPPPPAPPVPPPAPIFDQPPVVPLRIKKLSRISPPPDLAKDKETVDKKVGAASSTTTVAGAAGVNDEIINQIKGGMFTLRKPKTNNENSGNKKERETPKAVLEMLNILGSLRRTSTSKGKVTLAPATNLTDMKL